MVCKDCLVNFSPQWRKINNVVYCNACATHFKRHGFHKDINYYAKILVNLKLV